ncbi:MAG: rhodanese [Verrucomicrobia bacterium]|nr:rhodanese [Verrucomicrobiota bacterium]
MDKEISAAEASKLFRKGDSLLLDVREADELAICSIAGARHIPMMEIPERLAEIPKEAKVIVFCHHGMRSMKVVQFLSARGYERVINLSGGIDAWAITVDPEIPRY